MRISTEEKIKSLDDRINKVHQDISELEQTKINLMMLKREIHFDDTKKVLETAFEETLKQLPETERKEMYKKFEDFG